MQDETKTIVFSTRAEFLDLVHECVTHANTYLQLFDPDFARWSLGAPETVSALRQFLLLKSANRLQLSMHRSDYLQQNCPRFLMLLKDFDHAMTCRLTPKNLHHLTDSFCLADNSHLVRRFHADHFRGVATFHSPFDAQISYTRFAAIWAESLPGLHPTMLGL